MKLIMEELIERVDNGERFHIDFEKRNMKVGRTYLIKDGEYDKDKYMLSLSKKATLDIILDNIEDFYNEYKYSMPSERSESKRRKYFKALSVEELSIDDMVNGESREVAQCILEGYILVNILKGTLYWDEQLMGRWFYQGNDPDLIILKKWIEK
jgi:hypothetical protein